MGVIGKQRDQGEEQGGKNPAHMIVQVNYWGISGITEKPAGSGCHDRDRLWLFELSCGESEGAGLGQQPGAKDPQGLRHRAGCGLWQ